MIWEFIQNQLLGMQWLNILIGNALSAIGVDTSEKIGGSLHFFVYDTIKIVVLRFNELQRMMPDDMTATTLSRQLKQLEEAGLIVRKEYSQIPPKVEYSLSKIGMEFGTVTDALGAWGLKYNAYLENPTE